MRFIEVKLRSKVVNEVVLSAGPPIECELAADGLGLRGFFVRDFVFGSWFIYVHTLFMSLVSCAGLSGRVVVMRRSFLDQDNAVYWSFP